ncbi:hypothetical protein ACFFQW_03075 [Umezawaea endophytica]|uniref:Uncharacterized protein n=1 Tax=Umezawaea endophytica TaxID=1654476 RepID=A0A9X3A117_9PSEU|nr:hypothetical protein [Umezawaea endophytica]MCS7479129.1 hypothetical protein [Umezawaea endophytica]
MGDAEVAQSLDRDRCVRAEFVGDSEQADLLTIGGDHDRGGSSRLDRGQRVDRLLVVA